MSEDFLLLDVISSPAEAGMIAELLRNNGVETILQGANFASLEPLPMRGGFSEIRLLVRADSLDAARQLYQAFFCADDQQPPADNDDNE